MVRAIDEAAGLALVHELEAVAGGGLRGRATVTNTAPGDYVVQGLEIVLPLADDHVELLDFTGRHERERSPQRHGVDDGLWLREGLGGRPGLDAATLVVAGTAGFSTTTGRVVGVHVGWSGNSVLRVERTAATGATIGGGEHLLPGEVVLPTGASYTLAVGLLRGRRRRARRPGRALARLPALARRPPCRAAGGAQRVGGRLLRPRPRPAQGDRRAGGAGGRRAVRARRRLVPRPARRHRRARRLVRRRDGLARRAGPPHRPRPVARHGVRAVVRAGDGQPRLRPLPRAPGVDPEQRRRPRAACSTAASRSST